MMKPLLNTCAALLLVSIALVTTAQAKMAHGNHKGSNKSLLAECLKPAALPSPNCGRVPTAVFGPKGKLYVVFSQHGHIYLTTSDDKGKTFQSSIVVNRKPERIYDDGENRPKIVLGKSGEIYVSWTHKTPGRYSGDVRFSRSLDGGITFNTPITVNSDRAIISHRFESMSLDEKGRVYLIWIDKRDKIKAKENQQKYAGVSLYYAVSDNSGESFRPNQKLVDHSCECCRIAVDQDSAGRVVALWRHVYPDNIRDHAIAYVSPENSPIQGMPIRATDDAWQIDGCPHHGPDLSIDSENRAHLAWFTQGEKNKGLMYGRFDFKNEKTSLVHSIDNSPSASRPQVQVMGDRIYLMWKKLNGEQIDLLISRSSDEGKNWSKPEMIATTKNGSDHPDWLVHDDELYASWHTQSEGLRLISVTE
ncbi:MAG: glycoside hydrolase [Pseudomonadales bacterium]|nr:glycoside hydrolase [Pseudomonadales bacterium]